MDKMKRVYFLLILLTAATGFINAQDWVVPEDKRGRLSTFPFTDETREAGSRIFATNCMSCHGTPGKGNFLNLVPPPGDPATEKIQRNSDGEIFYKVSTGKGQMPSFRNILSTDEIWDVISYVRSFNKSYVQKVMKVITSSAYPGAEIRMDLSYDPSVGTVKVIAEALTGEKSVPVTGAGIRLFIERYFGLLAVDEEKTTDMTGSAVFSLPSVLPGDTAGNLRLSAKFTDEMTFGAVTKDTIISAGTKTFPVSLVAKRAMWNRVRMAPVWIILTYTLGVLIVWGFIFLVMLKLRDIYTVGNALATTENELSTDEMN